MSRDQSTKSSTQHFNLRHIKEVENMSKFLNVSNHVLTQDQLDDLDRMGFEEVLELPEDLKSRWGNCDPETYQDVCDDIVKYMDDNNIPSAHLAGYPAAVAYMCMTYISMDNMFYFSHTKRVSEEVRNPDGSVTKRNVFKHEGWHQFPWYMA